MEVVEASLVCPHHLSMLKENSKPREIIYGMLSSIMLKDNNVSLLLFNIALIANPSDLWVSQGKNKYAKRK